MDTKTSSVKRENKPGIRVTGFPDKHTPFVSLAFGDDAHNGEFSIILYLDAARAVSVALADAIKHAERISSEEAA